MIQNFLFSIIIHFLIFATIILAAAGSPVWRQAQAVYQVELVSAPKISLTPGVSIFKGKSDLIENKAININDSRKRTANQQLRQPDSSRRNNEQKFSGRKVNLNLKNFPYIYYINLIYSRIQENWQPPFQLYLREKPLSAVLSFLIQRDGTITEIRVEKTAGRFVFDQTAMRAVLLVNPLPPLPDEYSGDYLTVHIEFEEKN